MMRGIDLAHEFGLIVFHHDDGDNRKLLPRLVEMGIEVLNRSSGAAATGT
jgi:hypothetical protein